MNDIKDFIIKECYKAKMKYPMAIPACKYFALILAVATPFLANKLGIHDKAMMLCHIIGLLAVAYTFHQLEKSSIIRMKASEEKIRELFDGFKISNLYLFPVSSKVGAKSTSFDLIYIPKSANGKTIDSILSNKKTPFKTERVR